MSPLPQNDSNNHAVLFVGHEATRTGAPIALLHFMRWFKANVGWPFSCLLQAGGDLVGEFRELCPTAVLYPPEGPIGSMRARIWNKAGMTQRAIRAHEDSCMRVQVPSPSLIYANTLAGGDALELASRTGARVLTHIHELEFSFRKGVGPERSRKVLDLSDHFIACSKAVARNLERHKVSAENIDLVYEFINTEAAERHARLESRAWLRAQLNAPEDAIVVGASGQMGWRKGSDIFVQVARYVRDLAPDRPIHFLWLGDKLESWTATEFLQDAEVCDLTERVTHIPSQPDTMRFFSGMDVFTLTSREDPYPLVCLEAAACGVPIICFDRAGGMPEFVEGDAGKIVPALDAPLMAKAILELVENPDLRAAQGETARQKVRTRHDIAVAGPQVFEAMKKTLRKNVRARRPLHITKRSTKYLRG